MSTKMNSSPDRKADLISQIQGRQEVRDGIKIPECVLVSLICQMQKRISERAVKNARMPYYPNLTLVECFDYFGIDIEELFDTDQINF